MAGASVATCGATVAGGGAAVFTIGDTSPDVVVATASEDGGGADVAIATTGALLDTRVPVVDPPCGVRGNGVSSVMCNPVRSGDRMVCAPDDWQQAPGSHTDKSDAITLPLMR